MVNRNLIRSLDSDQDFLAEVDQALIHAEETGLSTIESDQDVDLNSIVEGRVIRIDEDRVLVDVGFKSEGTIPLLEWEEEDQVPQIGERIKVLVEDVEDAAGGALDPYGMISLSKRKAEKILAWQEMMKTIQEGQVVTGTCTRKIKGGLLVDIGVNVFLPASQVDIRRPHDIGEYIGRVVQCEVLKIDEARRNIVVSRRSLIEKQRQEDREQLLRELQVGQVRKGVVKNIAEFGAFVDLGGIDGLLHITDMSHGRIGHPSELVSIDQEIDVMILNIDYEREKIALGMKQMTPSPWDNVEEKYQVGSTVKGKVVNVMSYGAFVKLEEGIEGLVHISEMSWTKRISHPNELVQIGDEINVVVLGIDKDKQEISLGMKQTQKNPWEDVAERYPEGSLIKGKVRNLTNYGAFIELE
jgi:small subunit ribosomal protein S1